MGPPAASRPSSNAAGAAGPCTGVTRCAFKLCCCLTAFCPRRCRPSFLQAAPRHGYLEDEEEEEGDYDLEMSSRGRGRPGGATSPLDVNPLLVSDGK